MDNESLLNALHEAASQASHHNSAGALGYQSEKWLAGNWESRFVELKKIAEERGVYDRSQFNRYLVAGR